MFDFKHETIDEPVMGILKTLVVAFIAWAGDAFMDNPVGTSASIVGLLYVFEKWRTQRLLRRKAEKELKRDKGNGEDT